MQAANSLIHMVTTVFAAALAPLDPDNDVEAVLVQLHELMCGDDMRE